MIDRFEELLRELGAELGTTLHSDRRGACRLNINDAIDIQLECDGPQEKLLVATFICDIPPGKFRENILRDSLKANGPFPENGTLGYSSKNNKLALFKFLKLSELKAKELADFLTLFMEKAKKWRVGVEMGTTASLVPTPPPQTASGMFGLK